MVFVVVGGVEPGGGAGADGFAGDVEGGADPQVFGGASEVDGAGCVFDDEPGSGDVPDGERVDGEVDADAAGFAGVEGDAGESLEFAEWLFDAGDPLVGVALDDFFTEAVAGVGDGDVDGDVVVGDVDFRVGVVEGGVAESVPEGVERGAEVVQVGGVVGDDVVVEQVGSSAASGTRFGEASGGSASPKRTSARARLYSWPPWLTRGWRMCSSAHTMPNGSRW